MADAITVQIAEAVKDDLNAETFSQAFTSVRKYLPVYDLKEMKTLHVTVVPKALAKIVAGRKEITEGYTVDVAVQKKVKVDDAAAVDPLMLLVEEIADFCMFHHPAGYPSAVCIKAENEPAWSYEHMKEFRQFTSVLTLTFKLIRKPA